MHNLGYKGKGTYTNGKLTVGDIDPWNVGYNQSGELRFFDADVTKSEEGSYLEINNKSLLIFEM